jgi:hypothetical protein
MNKFRIQAKQALFHVLMWPIALTPLVAVVGLISVSALTYDTLNHPDRHAGSGRVWIQIAQLLYYLYEGNIWQSQKNCVRYDEELLYIPSSGCTFSNIEFVTKLSFSDDGRVIDTNSQKKGPPILVLGDSPTMGWGVNDDETYSFFMGLSAPVPIFNLGVSSYGIARELLRARRHSQFKDSKCLLIQYHENDFEENQAFLNSEGLPRPTPERFEWLLRYKPTKLTFFDVLTETFKYMWTYPSYFWADLIGWRPVLWLLKIQGMFTGPPRENAGSANISNHVDVFLRVLNKFSELTDKTIFVIAGAGIPEQFASVLMARADVPRNIVPIKVQTGYGYFYTLDMHQNKFGHQEIAKQILNQMQKRREGRNCLNSE